MKKRSLNQLVFAVLLFAAPTSAVAQELYFPSSDRDWATVTPESLDWDVTAHEEVFKLVEQTNGKSFLILKDGQIVAERY